MLDKYNHLILKTASSKNMEDLTLNVFMAIQAGIDVAGTNADLVPKDRFIACTQFPQQEDKDMIIGYWDTRDAMEIKYWLHKVQLNGLYRHHQIIPALVFLSSISKRIITIILMEQYVKLFI